MRLAGDWPAKIFEKSFAPTKDGEGDRAKVLRSLQSLARNRFASSLGEIGAGDGFSADGRFLVVEGQWCIAHRSRTRTICRRLSILAGVPPPLRRLIECVLNGEAYAETKSSR
jgi:hypothetical protein